MVIEDTDHVVVWYTCMAGADGGSIRAVLSGVVQESSGVRGLMRGWLPAYTRIGPLFLGVQATLSSVPLRTPVQNHSARLMMHHLSLVCSLDSLNILLYAALLVGLPVLIEQSRVRLFGLEFLK